MSLITRMCRQDAVLWTQSKADAFGRLGYAAPVQIRVRWEDSQKEFIGANGTKQISQAVVYVLQDVKPGDMIKLGTLTTSTNANPQKELGAKEIKAFDKLPTLRATQNLRTCYL